MVNNLLMIHLKINLFYLNYLNNQEYNEFHHFDLHQNLLHLQNVFYIHLKHFQQILIQFHFEQIQVYYHFHFN